MIIIKYHKSKRKNFERVNEIIRIIHISVNQHYNSNINKHPLFHANAIKNQLPHAQCPFYTPIVYMPGFALHRALKSPSGEARRPYFAVADRIHDVEQITRTASIHLRRITTVQMAIDNMHRGRDRQPRDETIPPPVDSRASLTDGRLSATGHRFAIDVVVFVHLRILYAGMPIQQFQRSFICYRSYGGCPVPRLLFCFRGFPTGVCRNDFSLYWIKIER